MRKLNKAIGSGFLTMGDAVLVIVIVVVVVIGLRNLILVSSTIAYVFSMPLCPACRLHLGQLQVNDTDTSRRG